MIAQAVKVSRMAEAERKRLVDENTHLRDELRDRYAFQHLVGHQRPDPAGVRAGRAGGAHQHDGAHPGRVGHRQGDDRARDPLQLGPGQEAVHQGELRGAARVADRVGAVRLRARRVHRRAGPEEGPLRAGRRRHALPRRDRRPEPGDAGEAAARAAGARVRAARRHAERPRQRAAGRRDAPAARKADRRRARSARTCSTG